ncbi:BnaA08g02150D [Brassica napus]|uniref:BnaA08g02150D protein n=1 Tax=Brassica napus TaxID=3708 RepID=A0A078I2J1_BRANA|nr:BnaA08g02150D [Brassica napus]
MVAMFQEDNGTSSVASSLLQVFSTMSLTRPTLLPSPSSSPFHSLKDLKPEERGLYLIHLLLTCANHNPQVLAWSLQGP